MASPQSLAGVVRQRLAAIETRLAYGIRLEVIRRELAEDGFETTPLSLRNALWRARRHAQTASAAPRGEKGVSTEPRIPGRAPVPSAPATTTAPQKPVAAINPLLEPKGFVYGGTRGIRKDDLI